MKPEPSSPTPFAELTTGRFALLLAVLVFVSFAEIIVGDRAPATNDFWFFGYPLAAHLKASLAGGEFPLWNPLSECGIPFLAQWNTLTLYPGSLFYLAFPLEWSLGVFCVLHLYLGGLGAWCLVRRLTGDPMAAAVGGLVYAFSGFNQACQMWPNNAAALGWAPWVFLAVIVATREGGRLIVLGAIAGAMQMLTGAPEIILATWILLAGFVAQEAIRSPGADRRTRLLRFSALIGLVALVSAAQLLPFLDLLAHSPRTGEQTDLSWPIKPLGVVNYLMPLFNTRLTASGRFAHVEQGWIHSYYLGGAALWLIVFAFTSHRRPVLWMAGVAAVFALLLAMGEHMGLYAVVAKVVPLGFTRFPSKFLVVPALLLPLLSAYGMRAFNRSAAAERPTAIVVTSLITLVLLGAAYSALADRPVEGQDQTLRLDNGRDRLLFGLLAIGAIILTAHVREKRTVRLACIGMLFIVWLDFKRHQPNVMVTVPREVYQMPHPVLPSVGDEVLKRRARMALLGKTQLDHAFHSRGSAAEILIHTRIDQFLNLNLMDGVMKFDGFFALWFPEQDELERVLHSWSMTDLRPGLADFMGIAWTSSPDTPLEWRKRPSARPLITAGQAPVFEDAAASVARLSEPKFDSSKIVSLRPGAKASVNAGASADASVEILRFDPHDIAFTVDTPVPTMAVIAQCFHPNWKPAIDGQPATLLRANHAFQAVNVPAGRHEIRLRYIDWSFRAGCALSLSGLLLLGGLWRHWRPSAATSKR
ncbi:MAG: hypothetical protein ISQ14_00590 [Verrucomicrobiae bacterium]|nr:hypothetical protein [Verrucomicrobiae bacterium]